ncbi:hypothetical protein JBE04_20440 [Streptomyces sp. PRKS01-29]|nr:hypothetical protein [Streptomyces sabulosicollis]MBI0296763.1 hypothetical protein [Streptomyces sabulosicollis]
MNDQTTVTGVTVWLGSDLSRVLAFQHTTPSGIQHDTLQIGSVTFHTSQASPEVLDRIAEAAAKLAKLHREQAAAKEAAA